MFNIITNSDLSLVLQKEVQLALKIEILNNNDVTIDVIQSNVIVEGTFKIDSTSDIRRTCSLSFKPDKNKKIITNPDGYIWVDKSARIYIGIKNIRTNIYTWYNQGYYYFTDSSSTYDKTTNTLTVSCCDYMIKLNGTKSGMIGGASQITIPAYEIDSDTGEIIKYNIIRDAIISILEQLGNVKKYMIDDVGEENAIEQINSDWEEYRNKHPLWNTIPYDLTFPAGSNIFSILTELRDLYPNYEMFFDPNGFFILQMIPNCDGDDIIFNDDFLQKILISENSSMNLTVKNVCEVWGKTIEADRFIEQTVYSDNIYNCSLEQYPKYTRKEKIAIKICNSNFKNPMLQINNLNIIPIYNESGDTYITENTLEKDKTYIFKIDDIVNNDTTITVAYLLGEWQPHAVTALVSGKKSDEIYTTSKGLKVTKYSKEYFQDIYNCNCVSLIPAANSPFTVEKIGEILDVKSGNEYDNITSDSLALDRAEYENWKNCRLTDSISIKTKIVPFADVNVKCSYRINNAQKDYVQTYIIKSISHDFAEGTTTWEMYKHYPSLKTIRITMGTHKALSEYSHAYLGIYTHEELTNFLEGGIY